MCTTREEKGCSFKVSTLSEKHLVTLQSFTGLEKKAHLNQTAVFVERNENSFVQDLIIFLCSKPHFTICMHLFSNVSETPCTTIIAFLHCVSASKNLLFLSAALNVSMGVKILTGREKNAR